jgi:hypothetical protein
LLAPDYIDTPRIVSSLDTPAISNTHAVPENSSTRSSHKRTRAETIQDSQEGFETEYWGDVIYVIESQTVKKSKDRLGNGVVVKNESGGRNEPGNERQQGAVSEGVLALA